MSLGTRLLARWEYLNGWLRPCGPALRIRDRYLEQEMLTFFDAIG